MTVLVDFQLSLFENGRSEKTIEAYLGDLQQFADWFLQTNGDDLSPQRLTATDLREYKGYLQLHKAAPSTINRKMAAIRAYAEWAGVSEAIKNIKGVKEQAAAPHWLDRREVSALTREAEHLAAGGKISAIRNLVILTILLNTGLRVSELCALELSDLTITDRKGELRVRDGKGEKDRTIPLNKTARQAFNDYLVRFTPLPNAKLFKITDRSVQAILEEIGHRAKVEVTPHKLRHTFAKSLIDSGVGMEKVAALLGHSNLETTRIYITPGQADLEKAVNSLD